MALQFGAVAVMDLRALLFLTAAASHHYPPHQPTPTAATPTPERPTFETPTVRYSCHDSAKDGAERFPVEVMPEPVTVYVTPSIVMTVVSVDD